MNKLLRGIGIRYGILFVLFGCFIVYVMVSTHDSGLYWNLILTFLLLALLPVLFYVLWKKKFKK